MKQHLTSTESLLTPITQLEPKYTYAHNKYRYPFSSIY